MADKQTFLHELASDLLHLEGTVERATGNIRRLKDKKNELGEKRRASIKRHVARLLPDTLPNTLAQMTLEVPYFSTPEQVERMKTEAGATFQRQRDRLLRTYTPATYDTDRTRMAAKVVEAQTDLASAQPYGNLLGDEDLAHLVDAGYGTKAYLPHFLSRAYYRDWKSADEAIERYGIKTWEELARLYRVQAELHALVQETETALEKLKSDHQTYTELTNSLAGVPTRVLEQLRVKLESWIDNQGSNSPLPHTMEDIRELNEQIAELTNEISEAERSKAGASKQVSSMRAVQAKAQRSRKRDVPDEYLPSRRNGSRGFGGSAGSTTTVVNHTHIFYDDTHYGLMLNHFSDNDGYPRHNRGGYHGSSGYRDDVVTNEREQMFAAARSDTSGQS